MHGHFRSHDKDGGHTIRSAVPKNPMLHANITALCLTEWEWLPIKVLHCGKRNFLSFWLLWPWPWPDDLHIRTWPIVDGDMQHVQIRTSYVEAFESYRLTDIDTVHAYIHTYTTNIIHHAASQVVNNARSKQMVISWYPELFSILLWCATYQSLIKRL